MRAGLDCLCSFYPPPVKGLRIILTIADFCTIMFCDFLRRASNSRLPTRPFSVHNNFSSALALPTIRLSDEDLRPERGQRVEGSLFLLATLPFIFNHLRTLLRFAISHLFSFQSLTHSFALGARANPFLFNALRTLCKKHPGGGDGGTLPHLELQRNLPVSCIVPPLYRRASARHLPLLCSGQSRISWRGESWRGIARGCEYRRQSAPRRRMRGQIGGRTLGNRARNDSRPC